MTTLNDVIIVYCKLIVDAKCVCNFYDAVNLKKILFVERFFTDQIISGNSRFKKFVIFLFLDTCQVKLFIFKVKYSGDKLVGYIFFLQ